ncbi:MAG: hypothetical protein GKR94_07220 [Gammaproteobacteria bacterium]|nr:hypothetical protein [Gammaproteobacteria bacterium]
MLMALLGGLLFRWLEGRWASRLEVIIGATFVLSAAVALLLLAGDPHDGEQLKDLLAGQLLWVTYDDLALPAILTAGILLLWCFIGPAQSSLLFYALFALAVTTPVQLVGVYLVFASLIFPALGAYASLKAGYTIGVLGYAVGLAISLATDLLTGLVIVWSLAVMAIAERLIMRSPTC